ncbi:MAG: PilZ domain-containing protein [Treponema sp.]|nr:PilZ domain-containing protein [Treponema sp.]
MYTLFIILIFLIVSFITLVIVFRRKFDFYITGLNYGFNFFDLKILWEAAKVAELEDAKALFFSRKSLQKCIGEISNNAMEGSSENQEKRQKLLAKLYEYLTKLQNEKDEKKGLESTLYLDKGQKLRIILPGQGVFSSKILNNGKELVISVPRRNDMILLPAEQWIGKLISIYLWRQSDARYVFDTTVISSGLFIGEPSLSIQHSTNLTRTQKRRAVRSKCQIMANLYVIKQGSTNITSVETQPGYKCRIEDISESGASIRIGGKGVPNMQIKLQFTIQSLIIMCGIIKTVEYNEVKNESLLHFECTWTEQQMKNEIFAYVYKMLPEKEKEVYEAMSMTDADEKEETGTSTTTAADLLKHHSIVDDEKVTKEDSDLHWNATFNLDTKYHEHYEYPEYEKPFDANE